MHGVALGRIEGEREEVIEGERGKGEKWEGEERERGEERDRRGEGERKQ